MNIYIYLFILKKPSQGLLHSLSNFILNGPRLSLNHPPSSLTFFLVPHITSCPITPDQFVIFKFFGCFFFMKMSKKNY